MQYMGLNEIRKEYLKFFESKGHLSMNSYSLVPQNDNSLLLINAGMAPLKPYFTGQETPPSNRMTTCQKCIRTGDIENVGKTDRHGTFFEMLGNFSFGDYFKEEAIKFAWEFITEVMDIPTDKLYISVYEEDDEAEKIWNEIIGVPLTKIVRMGKEDNFWEHGVGPCGPCSEIYYDRGEKYGCGSPDCKVGCECDRYIEFWNLVFTQFEKTQEGEYKLLDKPNIDTGMGLERLALMMQDVDSIFDVDTIKTVRDEVCKIAKVTYKENKNIDVSIRLIADHIRSVVFMTSDGILPSNEGRGYVLRRLLRRACRHGKLLGIEEKFIVKLVSVVIETSKVAYPEIEQKIEYIMKVISNEEEKFHSTIDQGLNILKTYIEEIEANNLKTLDGKKCFKLYDTYGFPIDLTKEILEEANFNVDEVGFHNEMESQRNRARQARKTTNYMGAKETVYNKLDPLMVTEFVGYDKLGISDSKIINLATEDEIVNKAECGQKVSVFADNTTFYATSGGQIGDIGTIKTSTGVVIIDECIKVIGNKIAHIGKVIDGYIEQGQTAAIVVDKEKRVATTRNHSATHLLQKALRSVLGTHVEQAGSNVNDDRLRFDFTHFSGLTEEELKLVEDKVNTAILNNYEINIIETSIKEARKLGAMALFGEKYGDVVRVVKMGDYSIELCGGTHLTNTSEVGAFKIISETGVASGVRRIEALTGFNALKYFREQESELNDIAKIVKVNKKQVKDKINQLIIELKESNKEIQTLKSKLSGNSIGDIIDNPENINGVKIIISKFNDVDMDELRDLGDKIKDKIEPGVVLLFSSKDKKVNIVSMATKGAIDKGVHAGKLIKEVSSIVGGGGGGRPNMAQAGGKNPEKIDEAFEKARLVLKEQIK